MSLLNTSISPLTFKAGSYRVAGSTQVVTFKEVTLNTALVSVTKMKKVVRGEIAAKDGEVIEYMGKAPAEINISGTITGANGQRPEQDVIDLTKIIDAPIAIDVVNEHLNQLGIYTIVILTAVIPQDPGGVSYQTFDISAIEEIKTELRISGT